MPSLIVIARAELRTRWASLLLLGLLAGLAGSVVVGAATLARRTATADARLEAATNADDVRSLVFGGSRAATVELGRHALDQPGVTAGRLALGAVARIDAPGIVYLSVIVGPDDWGHDILSPVLSAGRLPDPDRADEVVVNEAILEGGPAPIRLGQRVTMHLLDAEEFASFDAGTPLVGRAGDQTVTVVGVVRLPGAPDDLPPLIGTPALAAAHPDGIGLLGGALVQLEPGADVATYTDAINGADLDVDRPRVLDEFPEMSVISTAAQNRRTTDTTTQVITTGLLALAVVAGLVGAAAVALAALRQSAASVPAHRVEAAIGMTSGERARARLLAATPAVALAGAVTLVAGLATAGLAPPGLLRLVEPRPGWTPNLALIAAVSVGTMLALVGAIALASLRALARTRPRPLREAPLVARVAGLGGRPPTVLGLRFALERTTGGGGPTGAIVTIGAGVAGVVAVIAFSASLDRLVDTPVRFGFPTDVVIADAGPDVVAELADDARFDVVLPARSADLVVDGVSSSGAAFQPLRGGMEWELASGRPPATDEEIVLGTRLAEQVGKRTGDVVTLRDRGGEEHDLAVVGVGVVANFSGGGLGRSAALTTEGLDRVASAAPYNELGLSVRPGVDLDRDLADLYERYELLPVELPREVRNLADIRAVPRLLGAFLGLLALLTLAHTVSVTARRRRRDVATARAIGFTGRQSRTTVVVMATTVAAGGLLVGIPLGLVSGTTVWRLVAEGAAVLGDPSYRWLLLAAVVPTALVVAVAVATVPARRLTRGSTVATLRTE